MAKEPRPKGYPKLKNYKPSQFMLPTSHYDKKKADRAVTFIENLCHTKGKWAGTPFWLLPWQEQLIRDIFGIVKADGNRQFRTAFVEICKKVGKSELAAAVALYLLYADNEPSAEVYGAAADRQQASIVFDVAKQMVEMSPALMKRSKLMGATKRIVNYSNAGYYQVLSAEVGGKHGFSVSGLVFDEIHTQPNRQLYDVLTKGSSDARQNPLHFIITTAGNDRHSIAYELHTKAVDILEGRRVDPTFYPVVYGLKDDEDWEDEANWYKVNPSLGYTVDIERLRDAYGEAKQNPADEVTFKWLRCNMWVSSTVAWIPDAIYMRGNEPIDVDALAGRDCYAGLDLSSTGDITALVLIFPPRNEDEKYVLLPYFWIPEETIPRRVKANSVPYDIWEKQGYIMSTEGNVIHYDFIEKFIMDLSEKYHILEIAVDRWNATQMIQNLEGEGFTIVPFGQGFSSMSAPTKEFYRLLMEGRIIHGGNPVLRWMAGNVVIDTDPAGNIKVKIDGLAASAASVIAMAGTEVWMSPVSMMMIHNPATVAWGDHSEMKKAMELLDAVKESIINAYVRKTGQSRAKLSHLMDAETWMDANKAVELGFADDILFQKEEQGSEGENGDSGAGRTENGTSDSVMFSRRAVNNALMNKLERHYGKTGKSVKDQAGIGLNGNGAGMQGTGISGSAGAEGDDPCNGCFGAAENACQKCEKKKVNTNVTGRSADDLRERLNFIKKYI